MTCEYCGRPAHGCDTCGAATSHYIATSTELLLSVLTEAHRSAWSDVTGGNVPASACATCFLVQLGEANARLFALNLAVEQPTEHEVDELPARPLSVLSRMAPATN
jgi:hypothetical protein